MRLQTRPTTTEVSREARNRAATISGRPGKATAVDTSTTGLMAGAASMKARAAAERTPPARSRAAIGTEAHSQPGRATPARLAAGTASRSRSGSALASQPGRTRAARAPLSSTPRTRKGSAWTVMETKMVAQVATAGPSSSSTSRPRLPTATSPSSSNSRASSSRPARSRTGDDGRSGDSIWLTGTT